MVELKSIDCVFPLLNHHLSWVSVHRSTGHVESYWMLYGVGSCCSCEFAWDAMSNITLSHCDDLLEPHATFQAFYPERKNYFCCHSGPKDIELTITEFYTSVKIYLGLLFFLHIVPLGQNLNSFKCKMQIMTSPKWLRTTDVE